MGYTVGAIVWDQAERDVKCPVSLAAYPCMQALLTTSWRKAFGAPHAAFAAVQLPGYTGALATPAANPAPDPEPDPPLTRYTGALNNGTGSYPGYITGEMVWEMRIAQEQGAPR